MGGGERQPFKFQYMDTDKECTFDQHSCGLCTCMTKNLGNWMINLDNHNSNVLKSCHYCQEKLNKLGKIPLGKALVLEIVIFQLMQRPSFNRPIHEHLHWHILEASTFSTCNLCM
jgi:hypothetical protein